VSIRAVRLLAWTVASLLLAFAATAAWAAPAWAEGSGVIYAKYYKNGQTVVDSDGIAMPAYTLVLQSNDENRATYGALDSEQGGKVGTVFEDHSGLHRGWDSSVDDAVTRIVVADAIRPGDTYGWFSGMRNARAVEQISNLNTSSATNMAAMFSMSGFKSLNLATFNTSKATTMSEMFAYCSDLENLAISSFDTSNVEDMAWMFLGCTSLSNVDISHFETSKVTDMELMFAGCNNLSMEYAPLSSGFVSLDLSTFDISNVVNKGYMFAHCHHLSLVKLSAKGDFRGMLPTPDPRGVQGATGRWVNSRGQVFTSSSIPPHVADTYAAEGSAAASALVKPRPMPPAVSPTPKPSKISVAKASISVKSKVYNGKTQKCAVPTVKVGGKTLRHKVDFTYSCKAGKKVGSYKVTVKGAGKYAGAKTATFRIVPKGTSISKLSKAKRAFTVKWKKPSKAHLKQTTGYQVRWSISKKFTKKATKVKTVKATSAAGKKCTLKVSKLKAKKTYYVQVRTYKKVGKATYYSAWSKAKSAKTKK